MKRVELLAPAKNLKAIKAAIGFADSVYFGVDNYNMRIRSENFSLEDINKVVNFCHDNELKAYLATNILVYDNEIESIRDLITRASEAGIDAVIIHDIAILEMARQLEVPFHISTQCNVSNSLSAKFYENLGARRIILARELSLEKIKEVKRNLTSSEIEVFVHGAMCSSVSGRCYFSQDICGTEEKSANRGSCVQPCRRRWWVREEEGTEYIYDGVRFMNSRELCTIAHIPELIEANIDCFKIEGRMRHPHYVEVVSKVYREAIDAYYDGSFSKKKAGKWVTELKKVYNRGFTTGFYFKRVTEEDQQHRSPSNLSHYRYIRVGSVIDYKPPNTALISLNNGYLAQNDDIIIMGRTTDTYIHQKVEMLKLEGNEVKKTPRGTNKKNLIIELKVNGVPTTSGADKIYIFTDKTFGKDYILP
ncbi:MAG: U32 family peptidase [Candidatus Lokiarchaeota archaeon]|nr:U32 family peptidase [Candidatus Lokiarchaeota archaeon]